MNKQPYIFLFFTFHFSLFILSSCYEPQESCLDIQATNYDVSSDDPCTDCCTFPSLTLAFQHIVETDADTSFLRYGVFYPNEGTSVTTDSVMFDQASFFISNILLKKLDGTTVGVDDTLALEFSSGDPVTISDNFAKLDRAIVSSRNVGTVITEGVFDSIQFTLGLEDFLQPKEITSTLPSGHPLDSSNDSINYEIGTGYIPNRLIVRYDTITVLDSLDFRFFTPLPITLPLSEPLTVVRGNNIKLTLKLNYMDWFRMVDLANASPQTIEEGISNNLSSSISVVDLVLE